jgi:hypothetical protein
MDKDIQNPYFTFGALLPDIAKGFSKTYNQLHKFPLPTKPSHLSIQNGIYRHVKTDAVFHNLESFHNACDELEIILKSNPELQLPKTFFIAHILVELLIDKQIAINEIEVVKKFYIEMNEIDNTELISYCESIHFFDFKSKILPRFDMFIQNEYALKLLHNENVLVALEKICFDKLEIKTSEQEKEVLIKLISEADNVMKKTYQLILDQTKEKLNYE